jgi:hypothetical protein
VGYPAAVAAELDLGIPEPVPEASSTLVWPAKVSEQVAVVAQVLASAPAPVSSRDVARLFAGKRAATVTPVLDALAAIGQARRLQDGRYAV